MKHADLLQMLQEFYRDKSALRQRHVAAARLVTDYAFNNAYQYVINREDVHLTWLHDAVKEAGADGVLLKSELVDVLVDRLISRGR